MGGKYRIYSAYKPSDVQWLGEIPKHWVQKRIKETARLINGYPFDSKMFEAGKGMPLVRIRDIRSSITEVGFVGEVPSESLIDNGDVLIGMDGDFNVSLWSGGEAALNQRVACVRATNYHLQKFIFFVLPFNMKVVNDLTYFTTVKHLSSIDILKTTYALPPESEFGKIVDFLDHETAKIDTLIEKQQQLIKLLKEKRQAVISHAVTKGLNPNAPMRDSGVEWLGEVPEGWEVRGVSKLSQKITNGYVGPTRDILVSEGVPYVQATHIKKGKVNFDDAYFVRQSWSDTHAKSILVKGDVLIVQTGAGTGDIGLVTENEEGFNCHALIIVQPIKDVISGDYLSMIFQSQYGYSVLYSIRTGGMHPHLNCGEVQFVKVPVPPREEQEQIVEHVSQQLHKIDTLVDRQLQAIELMQERRTALISAAVTGKIDVRNWVAPGPANNAMDSRLGGGPAYRNDEEREVTA
jgi:type I restriction enzyme S subunit